MGSEDYCSISIITARAFTEIRKRRSAEITCTRSFTTCISPRWILSRWFETKKVKEQQLQYVSRKKEKKINRKKKDYLTRLERESSSPSTALEGKLLHTSHFYYFFNMMKNQMVVLFKFKVRIFFNRIYVIM